jgi:hypothetical protein
MAGRLPRRISFYTGRQRYNLGQNPSVRSLGRELNSSLNQVMRNFDAFLGIVEKVSPDVLIDALEPTFGKALTYCPLGDTGRLRASGYLEKEKNPKTGQYNVFMGFGRHGNPPYAVYVHEVPATHAAPTRHKFLQAAIEEDMNAIKEGIVAGYRALAGGS